MNATRVATFFVIPLLAASSMLKAQDDQADTMFRQLIEQMAKGGTPREHENWLRRYLAEHADRRTVGVLRARVLLGGLLLQRLAPIAALSEYDAVVAAKIPDNEGSVRELRARALYGVAQAASLGDQPDRAEKALKRLLLDYPVSRFAAAAKAEQARLASTRPVRAGLPAPEFGPRQDLGGEARDLTGLRGSPSLLVFWSPDSKPSVQRLVELRKVWINAGRPRTQLVAMALAADEQSLRNTVTEHSLDVVVVACQREALDRAVLDWQVTAVPQTFLIGADGILVARDLTPGQLHTLLTEHEGR